MTPATAVTVPTDAGAMPAVRWLPPSGTGPGLLLLQEIFGVSDYIRRRGADLAAAGYVVLAPELYWRLDPTPIDESSPGAIEQAMNRAQQLDWAAAVADSRGALENLAADDVVIGRPGVIGFCFAAAAWRSTSRRRLTSRSSSATTGRPCRPCSSSRPR